MADNSLTVCRACTYAHVLPPRVCEMCGSPFPVQNATVTVLPGARANPFAIPGATHFQSSVSSVVTIPSVTLPAATPAAARTPPVSAHPVISTYVPLTSSGFGGHCSSFRKPEIITVCVHWAVFPDYSLPSSRKAYVQISDTCTTDDSAELNSLRCFFSNTAWRIQSWALQSNIPWLSQGSRRRMGRPLFRCPDCG